MDFQLETSLSLQVTGSAIQLDTSGLIYFLIWPDQRIKKIKFHVF